MQPVKVSRTFGWGDGFLPKGKLSNTNCAILGDSNANGPGPATYVQPLLQTRPNGRVAKAPPPEFAEDPLLG